MSTMSEAAPRSRLVAVLAAWEMLVAVVWGLGALVMFAGLAGMTAPAWDVEFFAIWGAMFGGPVLLFVGSALTLAGSPRLGPRLALAAALALAALVVVDAAATQGKPGFGARERVLYAALLAIAASSVLAAYAIARARAAWLRRS